MYTFHLIGVIIFLLGLASTAQAQGMLGSKHNLSVSGPGPVKAVSETQICVFCHTPHHTYPMQPLWNHTPSKQTYTIYSSTTLNASLYQPNGTAKLCLSCHDGTVAIGSVGNLGGVSTTITVSGTDPEGKMPAGNTNLGTNLTNDHPISFVFDNTVANADGELVNPASLIGDVGLRQGLTPGIKDSVQCTSCHDPHRIQFPKFLRQTTKEGLLCLTCHNKPGWQGSTHESSLIVYPQGSSTTVRDQACLGCHHPHTKIGAQRLLREGADGAGSPAIEETCYQCHQPTGTGGVAPDLKTEFNKAYKHPVTSYLGHEPMFTAATPTAEPVLLNNKHVECPDCHNPHRVRPGKLHDGMQGIDITGAGANDVTQERDLFEYEVCFRCHGDTYLTVIGSTTQSGIPASNKRQEFQTTNSAFHPVAGQGRNQSVNLNNQLTPNGLSTIGTIKCTDCHNNNLTENTSGRASNYTGTEPLGPHGSIYPSIRRAYYFNDINGPASWNQNNFNLCFRCHDVTKLTDQKATWDGGQASTNFYDDINGRDNLHWIHLINRISKSRATCKNCHYNIHSNVAAPNTRYNINGVVSTTPPSSTPTRLINFSPDITPLGGRPKPEWWFDTTTKERKCYLTCHAPDFCEMGDGGGGTRNSQYRPSQGDLP